MAKLPMPYRLPEIKIDFQYLRFPDGIELDKHVYVFAASRNTENPNIEISYYYGEEDLRAWVEAVLKKEELSANLSAEHLKKNKLALQFENVDSLDAFLVFALLHNGFINSNSYHVIKLANLKNLELPTGIDSDVIFQTQGGKFWVGVRAVYSGHDDNPRSPELLEWLRKKMLEWDIEFSEISYLDAEQHYELNSIDDFDKLYELLYKWKVQTPGEAPKA